MTKSKSIQVRVNLFNNYEWYEETQDWSVILPINLGKWIKTSIKYQKWDYDIEVDVSPAEEVTKSSITLHLFDVTPPPPLSLNPILIRNSTFR